MIAASNSGCELQMSISTTGFPRSKTEDLSRFGNRDRADLQQWFEELWNDTSRVEDVKQAVLDYLLQVYRDQSPQFVYYKTLFELFRRFIEEGLELDDNLRRVRLPDTGIWRALYLHTHLATWARSEHGLHAGLICGDGGNAASLGRTEFDDILTNFSPISKRRAAQLSLFTDQTEEIDLLIATDCISEGQNLQDCDLLVNYDIHWNPVRIIQRFGRIDRIGSRNDAVQLVNFWPVADLDRYLGVKHRVEARMALVDLAATQTDNLLDTTQLEELIKDDLLFRDHQLKRLKDEVLDLEDLDESISLSDFSLDEFRQDLLNFLQAHRAELERAPLGLYAVVPATHSEIPIARPGVIYCLRQKTDASSPQGERINPLAPHYLVYVHDTGEVRLAFTQAKTVLNLFRGLALGRDEPFSELCRLFDRQTANGSDMSAQSRLIRAAVESITSTFQQKLASGLQGRRDFVLPLAAEQPNEDETEFELVTWLVLKGSASFEKS